MNYKIDDHYISPETIVYVSEYNLLLQEVLLATGKFIKDPNTFFPSLFFTTAQEAHAYGYGHCTTVSFRDAEYYWKHVSQKSAV